MAPAGPGLVAWDRWAAGNHNSVTLAASGAGKSYLAKLEILRSLLDKAIMAAYHQAGITADPRTSARPAPLLPALAAALRAARTEPATAVADRLVPFTDGTHAALFAAPTTTRPEGHLVVFSLRDVPDELRLSLRGNRRLNHAIHMAAVTQIRYKHSPGRASRCACSAT